MEPVGSGSVILPVDGNLSTLASFLPVDGNLSTLALPYL